MFDILSFFTEDTTSYAAKSIVMYVFDETRTDEFIKGFIVGRISQMRIWRRL